MNKGLALEKLRQKMAIDQRLPFTTHLVFGEGNPEARMMFIGEAPGAREDELQRPFVGRSGQLLRQCIRNIGWQEQDVYITNIVKRRPPENRDPSPEEIALYQPYLEEQINIIAPSIIITLGRFSMNFFLPEAKITCDQGKLFKAGDWSVFPMLHPAFALRGTRAMKNFKESFEKLKRIISD